jgi:hypothetical protein
MTFEEALEAYARKYMPDAFKDGRTYDSFDVRHEEGWSNEHTDWPATTVVTFRAHWVGKTGQKHNRKREVYAPHDEPVEFMRALFDATSD